MTGCGVVSIIVKSGISGTICVNEDDFYIHMSLQHLKQSNLDGEERDLGVLILINLKLLPVAEGDIKYLNNFNLS